MKNTTDQARAMTDEELARRSIQLRLSIPAAQSLLAAIKREQRRRKRRKEKAA